MLVTPAFCSSEGCITPRPICNTFQIPSTVLHKFLIEWGQQFHNSHLRETLRKILSSLSLKPKAIATCHFHNIMHISLRCISDSNKIILYLSTIGFKAQSLSHRVQIKLIKSNLIKCRFSRRRLNRSTQGKPLSREENQQTQPHTEVLCISIEPWQNKILEEKTSLLTSGGSIVGACLSLSSFCFFSGGGESDSCPT